MEVDANAIPEWIEEGYECEEDFEDELAFAREVDTQINYALLERDH